MGTVVRLRCLQLLHQRWGSARFVFIVEIWERPFSFTPRPKKTGNLTCGLLAFSLRSLTGLVEQEKGSYNQMDHFPIAHLIMFA